MKAMKDMDHEEVLSHIYCTIQEIEAQHDCKVILAVEAGSRAWGFASKDSDWDVRFIYVKGPHHYLSVNIENKRDVIEREPEPGGLDINGWDLKKTLQLMKKSNPALLEWLSSPIVYFEDPHSADRLRQAMSGYYSRSQSWYHYRGMAIGNQKEFLQGDSVWTKKYLYVLRPVLAMRWIETQGDHPVPVDFMKLVDGVLAHGPGRRELNDLVARKMAGEELDKGPHIPALDAIIVAGLGDGKLPKSLAHQQPKLALNLDTIFREIVMSKFDRIIKIIGE